MSRWWRLAAALAVAGLVGACIPTTPPVTTKTSPSLAATVATCTAVSLSTSAPSRVSAGQLVAVTAHAKGCSRPEFRFVLTDSTGTAGSVMQGWSLNPTWTWDTSSTSAGRYVVRGDARTLNASSIAPPEASAYLSFTVQGRAAPLASTCKLPVSGTLPGSGGFIQMPAGTFTADPASNVSLRGQADISGLRRGYTYDPVHGQWLPVPRDWVMPDFSSYVYIGTEYPHVSNQPELHVVTLPAGTDAPWINGDQLYGLPIALRPEGVYGAPGPEIITMVDPSGAASTVDQGHLGLYAVITPTAIWATGSAGPDPMTDVQRIDPLTQSATDWFKVSGRTAVPIGVDADGSPIIAVGTQTPNGRIAATEIEIVPQAATGPGAHGFFTIYLDATHPLTIVGWPVVSSGTIWIETDQGLWAGDRSGRIRLVSSHTGYIAGGCL